MPQSDGGPAFPRSASHISDADLPLMTADNGSPGMSLRDYAAIMAMQGILASLTPEITLRTDDAKRALAADCYALADAMIAEREKGGGA